MALRRWHAWALSATELSSSCPCQANINISRRCYYDMACAVGAPLCRNGEPLSLPVQCPQQEYILQSGLYSSGKSRSEGYQFRAWSRRSRLKYGLANVEIWLKVVDLHEDALLSFRLAHDVEASARLLDNVKDHKVKGVIGVLTVLDLSGSATGQQY